MEKFKLDLVMHPVTQTLSPTLHLSPHWSECWLLMTHSCLLLP